MTPAEKMAYFDNMPIAVRQRVAHGVLPWKDDTIARVAEQYGEDLTLKILDDHEERALEGYRQRIAA